MVSLQTQFSLLHLEALETGLTAVCSQQRMTVMCWGPLHKGVLAGGKTFDHSDWQQQREAGVVAQLERFAAKLGVTPGPMLYLMGELDPNGPYGANRDEILRLADLGVDITLVSYPEGIHALDGTDFWPDIWDWLSTRRLPAVILRMTGAPPIAL